MDHTKKASHQHGGARKGAGRKVGSGKGLTEKFMFCLSAQQLQTLTERGKAAYLRAVLDHDTVSHPAAFKQISLPQDTLFAAVHPLVQTIPYASSTAQCGFPSPALSYDHEDLDFNTLLVKSPASTIAVRCAGDSMIDAGISDGDLVVIDRSLHPKSGQIALVRIDAEFTLKTWRMVHGKPELHPENASGLYPVIYPCEAEEWECIGVVTFVIKSRT